MNTKDKTSWLKEFLSANMVKYIVFAVIFVALTVSVFFTSYIDSVLIKHLEDKSIIVKGNQMLIHILSVGEADACVIELPNREVCVIDTGTIYSSYEMVSYINSNVINHNKNKQIDYLFYTHADDDHSGGVEALLHNFDVKNIIRPRQYANFETIVDKYGEVVDTENYTRTMTAVYNETGAKLIKAEDGLTFEIGEAKFEIFYLLKKYKDSNNYSYYIKLTYKNKSMLFTGDALVESEEDLIKIHKDDLDCDILKVGHHGGDNSNSLDFLKAVSPNYSIISVGSNRLGHPHETVLDNLSSIGSEIYRTDKYGNILIGIGDDITFYFNNYSSTPLNLSFKYIALIIYFAMFIVIIIDLIRFIVRKYKYITKQKMQITNIKL